MRRSADQGAAAQVIALQPGRSTAQAQRRSGRRRSGPDHQEVALRGAAPIAMPELRSGTGQPIVAVRGTAAAAQIRALPTW
ncbi:hypothetical protein ACQPZ2_16770 [Nocardia pseudovaccinii]|uniref:hypothetical protein n=1 Tax=Nocardia pseudovaccinii TaxID=189540 RepID=UPI003D8D517D